MDFVNLCCDFFPKWLVSSPTYINRISKCNNSQQLPLLNFITPLCDFPLSRDFLTTYVLFSTSLLLLTCYAHWWTVWSVYRYLQCGDLCLYNEDSEELFPQGKVSSFLLFCFVFFLGSFWEVKVHCFHGWGILW